LSKPQALGHVELFSGTAEAVLLRHVAPFRLRTWPASGILRAGRRPAVAAGRRRAGTRGPASAGLCPGTWQLELAWRPGDFVQVNAQVNTR
jgi:23S rRNA (uracil1939-C5)-methyltransferase